MGKLWHTILSCIVLVFILAACAENDSAQIQLSAEEENEIRQIGKQASGYLLKSLKSELTAAIKQDGPAGALHVCNIKAMNLTRQTSHPSKRVVGVKRASYKYRNPDNAPDRWEQQALDYFTSADSSADKPVREYMQKIVSHGETSYRYYQPLNIQSICLNCHGPEQTMNPQLLYNIKRLYPDDRATGYQLDDFRGVIRISIKGE